PHHLQPCLQQRPSDPDSRARIQNLPRREHQTPGRRLDPLPLQRRIHRTRIPKRTPTTPKQPPPQTPPNSSTPQPSSRYNKPGPSKPSSILRRPSQSPTGTHSSSRLPTQRHAEESQPRPTCSTHRSLTIAA